MGKEQQKPAKSSTPDEVSQIKPTKQPTIEAKQKETKAEKAEVPGPGAVT